MTDTNTDTDIERLAPQKLLGPFGRGKVFLCIVIALAIHAAVIGTTSMKYIYFTWINPEAGRALEEAEAREAAEGAEEEAVPTRLDGTKPEARPAPPANTDFEAELEARSDTPVVKEGTRVADPAEIPTAPDAAGVSIDETTR